MPPNTQHQLHHSSLHGQDGQTKNNQGAAVHPYSEREHRLIWQMRSCYIFATLDEYEQWELTPHFESREFEKDETIFEIGDECDGIYWIEKGQVKMTLEDGREELFVRGNFFGELALILAEDRTQTCVARTKCKLDFLSAECFEYQHGKLRNFLLREPKLYRKFCMENFNKERPPLFLFR